MRLFGRCSLVAVGIDSLAKVCLRAFVRLTYANAMLFIPDAVGCHWWVVAWLPSVSCSRRGERSITHLTCSLTNCVVPVSDSSSHLPKNSSPRNGFRGFFSLPSFSLLLEYCCLSVLRNHLRTRSARFSGSGSRAGATKRDGCSVQ